jgi:HEAT repeat protein
LKEIALNNPDPEVQERAVHGLAQMSGNEGIPALIDIAQSNVIMNVRKNAIYALGRSNDPRAKEALQSILQGEN